MKVKNFLMTAYACCYSQRNHEFKLHCCCFTHRGWREFFTCWRTSAKPSSSARCWSVGQCWPVLRPSG